MSVCISFIPDDFSELVDFALCCKPFPFPHKFEDIRKAVIASYCELLNVEESKVLPFIHGFTYDGAAVNRCFSPNPDSNSISRAEREERLLICEKYKLIEEATCIEHRFDTALERVFNDDTNQASNQYRYLLNALYEASDFLTSSQPNEQELRRAQEEFGGRIGRVITDIKTPKTRWGYNAARCLRNTRIVGYYKDLDIGRMSCKTAGEIQSWRTLRTAAENAAESVSLLLPIIARVAQWTVNFQTASYPTMGLEIYALEDILCVIKKVGDYVDDLGDSTLEEICSKFQAEFEMEFEADLASDYLKLAQLFDCRTSLRVGTRLEAERLLRAAKIFCKIEADEDIGRIAVVAANDQDIFGVQHDNNENRGADEINAFDKDYANDCLYFLNNCMSQIRKRIQGPDGVTFEYWSGAERELDIDVLAFYREHFLNMPILSIAIRAVLGHKAGSDSAERVFSRGGIVIAPRRCSLKPTRADKLITNAVRFARANSARKTIPPKLPSFGIIDNTHAYLAEIDDASILFVDGNINAEERVVDERGVQEDDDAQDIYY
jgi:hAT family C-terminal dimerisation region